MKRGLTGEFVRGTTADDESVRPFVPKPLPPLPPLDLSSELREEIDRAHLALGRLDSVSTLLSDKTLFLYAYVRKEAVLSSQIEGTQSSLSDLLLFEINEAPGVPLDDVREVSSYVRALEHGIGRIRRKELPLSNRLLCEIHRVLLEKGRGSEKSPGEFRRSQNWIGGTRPGNAAFVPPPPDRVAGCMSELEKFLHDRPLRTSPLLKAALAHVQFETIHPFLDGNGRLGRLLITLTLCAESVLRDPLLYLSVFFKTHHEAYYDLLQRVRTEGDWETWIEFFVRGTRETAEQAVSAAHKLDTLFREDRDRVRTLGRIAGSALRVHEALQTNPILSVSKACERTRLTAPTVTAALSALGKLKPPVVHELTGKRRNRLFGYRRYLQILGEDSPTRESTASAKD